jgi:hypothetical protein
VAAITTPARSPVLDLFFGSLEGPACFDGVALAGAGVLVGACVVVGEDAAEEVDDEVAVV